MGDRMERHPAVGLWIGFVSAYITFDSQAFRDEFRKRVLRSKRTIAEVTNEITFQMLKEAYRQTPKADRAQIDALGITYRTVNRKGTKLLKKPKPNFTPNTTFKLIALKELWARGPSPRSFANAAALYQAIQRKLSRRASSVGFIPSGWVPAMRALIRRIHGGSVAGTKSFKNSKGGATPATDASWEPFAEIENATGMSAPYQSEASRARVEAELTQAWSKAVDIITADMASYAAKQVENALHAD